MSKWRIWADDYWGESWNDRREISSPEFEGTEIPDEEVAQYLLEQFKEEYRKDVDIDNSDPNIIYAILDIGTEDNPELIGFHAERVEEFPDPDAFTDIRRWWF